MPQQTYAVTIVYGSLRTKKTYRVDADSPQEAERIALEQAKRDKLRRPSVLHDPVTING